MKVKFFWLVVVWILAVALGVLEQGVWAALFVAGLGGFMLWLVKSDWRLISLVILVGLLGWWRGDVARVSSVNTQCDIPFGEETEIVDTPELLRESRRLIVARGDCKWLVSTDRHFEVSRGDRIVLRGGDKQNLDEVREYSEGYAEYLERRGISGTWRQADIEIVAESEEGAAVVWRRGILERINRLWGEPDASVIGAMLLAERGSMPEEFEEQFRAAGVSHILAISGLHISLLTGVIVGLLYLMPISPWTRTLAAASLIWLYVVFIGLPASALRAASFWSLTLMAFRLHRLVSLPTVITFTAAVLMAIYPRIIFEIGFQLSISAVLGIFLALFASKRVNLPVEKGGLGEWLIRLVLVSLGAALATGPLAAYHFGTISLISVVANVLVVPLVPLVLLPAMAAVGAAIIWEPFGLLVAYIPHVVLRWFALVTGYLGGWPGVYIQEVELPLWGVGVFYGVAGLIVLGVVKVQKRSWRDVWE